MNDLDDSPVEKIGAAQHIQFLWGGVRDNLAALTGPQCGYAFTVLWLAKLEANLIQLGEALTHSNDDLSVQGLALQMIIKDKAVKGIYYSGLGMEATRNIVLRNYSPSTSSQRMKLNHPEDDNQTEAERVTAEGHIIECCEKIWGEHSGELNRQIALYGAIMTRLRSRLTQSQPAAPAPTKGKSGRPAIEGDELRLAKEIYTHRKGTDSGTDSHTLNCRKGEKWTVTADCFNDSLSKNLQAKAKGRPRQSYTLEELAGEAKRLFDIIKSKKNRTQKARS